MSNFDRSKRTLRPIRDKILIMCETTTGVTYMNEYTKRIGVMSSVDVRSSRLSNGSLPGLIEEVLNLKRTCPHYNEIWVVYDYNNNSEFDVATATACQNRLRCAFSNISLEYWFLLHCEDIHTPLDLKTIENKLKTHLGFAYDTNPNTTIRVFNAIIQNLSNAEGRAVGIAQLYKRNHGQQPSSWCSSTLVHQLTQRLRRWRDELL